jgi:hypothetical protein
MTPHFRERDSSRTQLCLQVPLSVLGLSQCDGGKQVKELVVHCRLRFSVSSSMIITWTILTMQVRNILFQKIPEDPGGAVFTDLSDAWE